jgi:hypothetical protein
MGPNVGLKLRQVSDGTSKTIMIGEIRAGIVEGDSRGVWALGNVGPSMIAMYGAGGDANGPNACYSSSDDVYAPAEITDPAGIVCGISPRTIARDECMTVSGGGLFDQAGVRSKHPGGAHVAMSDASVQWINDDVETSGCLADCCAVWDEMIMSSDGGRGGPYNGVPGPSTGPRGGTPGPGCPKN